MERKTESFERRRCFPRAEPQMPAVPAGWRVDLSLPGMQILHKLYTSDVRRRTCMRFDETRRRMEREARVPTEYRPLFSATFFPFFLYSTVVLYSRASVYPPCLLRDESKQIRRRESQGNIRLHFPPWILDREWRRKIRKSRTSTFN